MEAPRCLKIESPPPVGTVEVDERIRMTDVNCFFPKTLVPQKLFSVIQGKEYIRNYQKPFPAKVSEYQYMYAFTQYRNNKRDQALNPNTIQMFCGLCGTHLVWKPHHNRDAHPLLHVNVQCLKSDWIALSEPNPNFVSRRMPIQDSSADVLSPMPLTVSNGVPIDDREHPQLIQEKNSVYHVITHAIISPDVSENGQKCVNANAIISSDSYSPSNVSEGTTLEPKFHSFISVDDDGSVCSETASTVTTSSMSMTSGWRLRDPNGVWSTTGGSTTNAPASKTSLHDRLSDKTSQDALLYQMRKHLSSHTRPRNNNALRESLENEEDPSETQTEDDVPYISTATSTTTENNLTPVRSTTSQTIPISTTPNESLVRHDSDSSFHSIEGTSPAPMSVVSKLLLNDDEASVSPISVLGNDSPRYTASSPLYEPPSIFFNKLLRPTR